MNAYFIQSKIRVSWTKGPWVPYGTDKVSGDKSQGPAD